jgi:uncharacterized protein YceH (UPF0502 family)
MSFVHNFTRTVPKRTDRLQHVSASEGDMDSIFVTAPTSLHHLAKQQESQNYHLSMRARMENLDISLPLALSRLSRVLQ